MNINYIELYRSLLTKLLDDTSDAVDTMERMVKVDVFALYAEYMQKIGEFEKTVLEAELDACTLQTKARMMQIQRNQHQEIDSEKIDAVLEEERKKQDSQKEDGPSIEGVNLSVIDQIRDVVKNGRSALEQLPEFSKEIANFTPDYSLAETLFQSFEHSKIEEGIYALYESILTAYNTLLKTIEQIRSIFPFNAENTLRNPEMLEAYKESLNLRLQNALMAQQAEKEKIKKLTEGI